MISSWSRWNEASVSRLHAHFSGASVILPMTSAKNVLCLEVGCDGAVFAVRPRNGPSRGISLDEYRVRVSTRLRYFYPPNAYTKGARTQSPNSCGHAQHSCPRARVHASNHINHCKSFVQLSSRPYKAKLRVSPSHNRPLVLALVQLRASPSRRRICLHRLLQLRLVSVVTRRCCLSRPSRNRSRLRPSPMM